MNYRNLRVAELIKEELGGIFLRELDLPAGVLLTITRVEVDKKLLKAVVKLGILPYEKGPETFKYVESARRELQFLLSRKMGIKPMPALKFEISEEKS
mgnify:CR=1 FL=1